MAQCPICGKIIKPDEKLCNSCSNSSNAGLKVEVDTMPDEKLDGIGKAKKHQKASEVRPENDMENPHNPVETDGFTVREDYAGDDKQLPPGDELITAESEPLDDFNLLREEKPAVSDEPLEMTRIEDEIVAGELDRPNLDNLHKPRSQKRAPSQNRGETGDISTDKLYIMPDEMVSSVDREKLITSLQSKIPGIIKSKQTDDNEDPPQEVDLPVGRREHGRIAPNSREPEAEPKSQVPPLPLPRKNGSQKESTAYFRGSTVILPAQMKLSDGEEMNIRGRKYTLKKKGTEKKSIILLAALSAILILAVAFTVPRAFSPAPPGQLVGLVLNSQTSAVIPGAQVILDEFGETVYSDDNGMFRFGNIKKGEWTVSATKPQYKTAAMGFSLEKGEISTITLALDPSVSTVTEEKKKSPKQEIVKQAPVEYYGKLTVITNAPGARVIVDNKMLGPGNKTYSNITTGEHRLVVVAEGYKEHSSAVDIKRDQNKTVDIKLQEVDVKYQPSEITFDQYLTKADDLAAAGSWREAAGNYTLALAKKEDPGVYYKRSSAYSHMGQAGQARDDLLKASRLYISRGKLDMGIDCLNKILDDSPKDTEALRERGFALLRKTDFDKALEDFKRAIDIDEDDYKNQAALGEAYYIIGKPRDALKCLIKARSLNDADARLYALSALASMARGNKGDAEKYYKEFEKRAGAADREEFSHDPEWQKIADMISQKD